jgi:DNA-binding CsgD family transcriptional regulator/tetratricopeptide (TPR) repeat protein
LLAAEGRLGGIEPGAPLPVPQTVRDVIGRRLDRLSPECNRLLGVAAVIGREFALDALGAAADLTPDTLLAVLEEAEASRVVEAVPGTLGRYRFSHALIRETLYEAMPTTWRARLHQRVGRALESAYGADAEPHLAELAWHFAQATPAGEAERARTYAERAAERAIRLHAYEEAVHHTGLALRLPLSQARRCELLLMLAEAQNRTGATTDARQTFEQAAEVARGLLDRERARASASDARNAALMLARAALGVGHLAITAGSAHVLLSRLLEEALAALGDDDSAPRAMALSRMAQELMFTGHADRALTLARESVLVARRVGDARALFSCLFAYYYLISGPDCVQERLALTTELLDLAESLRDPELALRAGRRQIEDLLQQVDMPALDAAIAAFSCTADGLRMPVYRWEAGLFHAMRALLDGRLDEAERLAVSARELRRAPEDKDVLGFLGVQLLLVRMEQGRSEELVPVQEQVVERFPGVPAHRAALALLYCEAGREDEARVELARLSGSDVAAMPRDKSWFSFCAYLAMVCARLGDDGCAEMLYEIARPYPAMVVVVSSAVVCHGSMSRYLGLLAGTVARSRAGDTAVAAVWWERATQHFQDALAHNSRLGAPALAAHTRYEHAALLIDRQRLHSTSPGSHITKEDAVATWREQARLLLEQALDVAGTLGLARLAEQATAARARLHELPAAKGSARPVRPALPDGLTEREVEVLQLIAAGKTNKEIASCLVVSASTVMHHGVSIYRKIDARGRADATAYAYRHGLAQPQST